MKKQKESSNISALYKMQQMRDNYYKLYYGTNKIENGEVNSLTR